MKAQKKLNIVLIVLIITLISIISFIGIFYQNRNEMVDKIPEYTLGTDLLGYRKVILEVDNDENTEEEKIYDNFVKSASIIKKRLATMKITDYTVRCDESTGQIEITIPENNQTEYILADITQQGNFDIKDNSTGEILMNNDDIKSVKTQTVESSYMSSKSISMNINFNSKGTKKFKDITKNYQNVISNETVANETTQNETSEENTVQTEDGNNTEETSTEEKAKEVSLNIDGTSMMTTTFSEIIDNGILSLSFGNGSEESDLKIIKYQAESLAAILENEPLPLKYKVTGNLYISTPIEQSNINTIIYIGIAIACIIFIVTIIKYKTKGLAISISEIGFIALYLLILRYTNVVLSLEGIFGIGVVYFINHIFNIMYLENEKNDAKKSYVVSLKKFVLTTIPVFILSVVCCFAGWMSIFSLGMVMFWGLIVSIIYNSIITQLFIINMKK